MKKGKGCISLIRDGELLAVVTMNILMSLKMSIDF